MHSTISTGQVVLAFSQRQQCLFNLKIGTFKDIKSMVFSRAEAAQVPKCYSHRQTDRKLTMLRVINPVSRTSTIIKL